jgi:2-(3-amino-3-carboxypropyl)histidine synthase
MSDAPATTTTATDATKQPPKRVVRRRVKKAVNLTVVPEAILADQEIAAAIGALPPAYSFEVHKTIHRLRQTSAACVGLQMPEGLLMYGCVLSDILKRFTSVTSVVLLGDVTYGACCVDDLGAKALGCDFLVHYGHSCLVPMTCTVLPTLYVFVEISVDIRHAVECLKETVPPASRVNVMGTVQFSKAVADAR